MSRTVVGAMRKAFHCQGTENFSTTHALMEREAASRASAERPRRTSQLEGQPTHDVEVGRSVTSLNTHSLKLAFASS